MKKFVLMAATGIAIFAASSAASAQDFFSGPAPSWSGPYIGAAGGYGWGTSHHQDFTGFETVPFSLSGGIAGGTAGWNWQLADHAVAGVEGDLSWADVGGSSTGGSTVFAGCGGTIPTCGTGLKALGTLRARLGYSMGRFLPYATFGLAVGLVHGNEGTGPLGGAYGQGSSLEPGWVGGAGVEMALAPRWTVKLEYLYVDLDQHTVFTDLNVVGPTTPTGENVTFHSSILRAGVNFHF